MGSTLTTSARARGPRQQRVKVALRIRPLNERERDLDARSCVSVLGQEVTIVDPMDDPKRGTKRFMFDYCYDSSLDPGDPDFASQSTIFADLGAFYLDNAWAGYNSSIFAYGQTGSGKTYTMTGSRSEPGLIPQGMKELFARVRAANALQAQREAQVGPDSEAVTYVIETSFLEIYNNKITDLLNPLADEELKVRESATMGIFVQGLSKVLVSSYEDIAKCMDEGNKIRAVAATAMNKTSSRSHSVLTVFVTRLVREARDGGGKKQEDGGKDEDDGGGGETRVTSKINLVDLAGSERQSNTQAEGQRFKEAVHINKSLSALGAVINALSSHKKFVPYRESVLTRLLQESLGGNSRTLMVAAISPASSNFRESISTLRFAQRAKSVINMVKKNVSAKDKLISDLRAEIARLEAQLAEGRGGGGGGPSSSSRRGHLGSDGYRRESVSTVTFQDFELDDDEISVLMGNLELNQDVLLELNEPLSAKAAKAEEIEEKRHNVLENAGVTLDSLGSMLDFENTPRLVNLSVDPSLDANLLFVLKEGESVVGQAYGSTIVLKGDGIDSRHCRFLSDANGDVSLINEPGSATYVNGVMVDFDAPAKLTSGDRVFLGRNYLFRFLDPRAPAVDPITWEDAVEEIASIHNLAASMTKAAALVVVVHAGVNLVKRDRFGKSDPFCVIRLGDRVAQTPVIKSSLNPEWEYEICWTGPFVDPESMLSIVVWDWDRLSSNDYMGEVDVALSSIPNAAGGYVRRAFPVAPGATAVSKRDRRVQGELVLSIYFV